MSDMLEETERLYEAYLDEFYRLERERSPLEGVFGFGTGPKNYPCHGQFARDLERLLGRFAAQAPDSEEIASVLSFIYFTAPARWESEPAVYWMLLAAQGLTRELVRGLAPPEAGALYDRYQAAYPCRRRLPAQEKLLALLKERRGPRN